MVIDWNAIEGGVVTAVVTICGGVAWLKQHLPQIKKDVSEIKEALAHIKKNQPAMQSAQDVAQAVSTNDAELRKAKIAAALHLLPQAVGVEIGELAKVQPPVIAKLLNDHIPALGGSITADEVQVALQVGSAELAALRNHQLLPTIREILNCIDAPPVAQQGDVQVTA